MSSTPTQTLQILLAAGLLFTGSVGRANGAELVAAPCVAYSSSSGACLGVDTAFVFPLKHPFYIHIGLKVGTWSETWNGYTGRSAGFSYSFMDDFESSYFASIGWGYDTSFPSWNKEGARHNFYHVGKRFLISENYRIAYRPYFEYLTSGDRQIFNIQFLALAIVFK